MLASVVRASSWSRSHGQQSVVVSKGMSHNDMSTYPWQLAWAGLVADGKSAGVFQGGRNFAGQSQHQSGALVATWSRLLLRPTPPTQSSSTLTRSPPQPSHTGLLIWTAQVSNASPVLSLTWDALRVALHHLLVVGTERPALGADCAWKPFGWTPSRQGRLQQHSGGCVISYTSGCARLLDKSDSCTARQSSLQAYLLAFHGWGIVLYQALKNVDLQKQSD